jgi:hypothetical protein
MLSCPPKMSLCCVMYGLEEGKLVGVSRVIYGKFGLNVRTVLK